MGDQGYPRRTRDGLFEVPESGMWDHNGTLLVTVRELEGVNYGVASPAAVRERARRLARRELDHPHLTRSARTVREFFADGCWWWTFAVSRLPRA